VMTIQKFIRVYPHGWSGKWRSELDRLLEQGWQVKFITPGERGICDYILEKQSDK